LDASLHAINKILFIIWVWGCLSPSAALLIAKH
jgi:hypothetical protein